MNNEIKEILDKLQKVANRETASRNALMEMKDKDYQLLLDYITNLQEEIERQSKAQVILDNELADMYDYKSRNEKAIELLKEAGCYDEETKTFCDDIWEELPELLNILEGDDKE